MTTHFAPIGVSQATPQTSGVEIFEADLSNPTHASAIVDLLAQLAESEFGRQEPMTAAEKTDLIPGLDSFPAKRIWLASVGGTICGITVCFLQFSIFSSKQMLNIHDLYTLPDYRRRGVGKALVRTAIAWARNHGHAFANIEVAKDNVNAMALYRKLGFVDWLAPTTFLEIRL